MKRTLRCFSARLSIRSRALSAAIVIALAGGPYRPLCAATVSVTGTAGGVGTFGASGIPGNTGGTGGAGQSVEAIIGSPLVNGDASNEATATGGRGGKGGRGGLGFPSGAGGDGGQGGDGGDATALAVTSVANAAVVANARATALGGLYGLGGERGGAAFPWPLGNSGAPGTGGTAIARAEATNLAGDASANSQAKAGAGFAPSGTSATRGDAIAGARATGSGAVTVDALANSADGINGVGGHAALAEVFGRSTGGGLVLVHGTLISAEVLDILNTVDGETAGILELTQTATGFEGASAQSRLSYTKSASYINLTAEATGGRDDSHGGDASASADIINLTGAASANVNVVGGNGDAIVGNADGSASAITFASGKSASVGFNVRGGGSRDNGVGGSGMGDFTATTGGVDAEAHIFGIVQGGVGRSATADSRAVATALGNGPVQVTTLTVGGSGVQPGITDGTGNDAFAEARGSNAGARDVSVAATVTGGQGGTASGDDNRGGRGGTASGVVDAFSTGGGRVFSVLTLEGGRGGTGEFGGSGGDGGDVVAVDSVTGGTAGALALGLIGYGGTGGSSFSDSAGNGGNASTRLSGTNRGGDDVQGYAGAFGGNAGFAGNGFDAKAANGGDANVAINLLDAGAVTAIAQSSGGNGSGSFYDVGGDGGVAHYESVLVESTGGGAVTASLALTNGNGGLGLTRGGNGQGTHLINAVQGITTGVLTLIQRAQGGSAGGVLEGLLGTAGEAESTLSGIWNVTALTLDTEAVGGNGSGHSAGSGGAGANAMATSHAENMGGTAATHAVATGGSGGGVVSDGYVGGTAGEAAARSEATSHGDGWGAESHTLATGGTGGHTSTVGEIDLVGHAGTGGRALATAIALSLGDAASVDVSGVAVGGDGGEAFLDGNAGPGGEAISASFGTATANSEVKVDDQARGGHGGNSFGGSGVFPTGSAGAGGNARSFASGSNQGASAVMVYAAALGGEGGLKSLDDHDGVRPVSARGGDANAVAEGTSRDGQVTVTARASAGLNASSLNAAGAHAVATGSGVTGTARALADTATATGVIRTAKAEALSSIGSTAVAEAHAMYGGAVAASPSLAPRSLATVAAAPDNDVVAAVLAGHVTNLANFEPGSAALALGTLLAMTPDDANADTAHHYSAQIDLQIDVTQLADPRHLLLGLLDPLVALGFDGLALSWSVEGITITRVFDSLYGANDFVSDRTLDLADLAMLDLGANQLLDLSLLLELDGLRPHAGFGFSFLLSSADFVTAGPAPVPLPSMHYLMLAALIGTAAAARPKRKRAKDAGRKATV